MLVSDCRLIPLPKVADPRGNLTFIEGERDFPFRIQRTYVIYDVPGGERRGGHAYRTLQEGVVCLSGSFDLVLSDGRDTRRVTLNRPYTALYVPRMIWRHMENFSTNSVALVIASAHFDEGDYIRDYEIFRREAAAI